MVIVAVALLLRIAWLLHARPEPVSDFLFYRQMGVNLLDHGVFGLPQPTAFLLPGHPALLAALMLVSRGLFWLSLGMVFLSTLACWLVYLLGYRLTGRRNVALPAAGACAICPTFVMYSAVLGTEHLFAVLMLTAALLTLRATTGTGRAALAAGVLLGLAALTRGEALFYLPVLVGLVWLDKPSESRRMRLRLVALMMIGTVSVVIPWVIRNAVVIQPGVMLSTVGGMNFYFGHNPNHYGWTATVPWSPGQDLEANRLGWELGVEHIRNQPESLLASAGRGSYKLFASPLYALTWSTQQPMTGSVDLFEPKPLRFERVFRGGLTAAAGLYLSLAGASLLLWHQWGRPMRILIPGLVLFNWFGHAVLFFGDPRFRYFLDLTLTIPIALVVISLWEAGRKGVGSPVSAPAR